MPPGPIALRVAMGGMRWRLGERDTIEVWAGALKVGTLTARALGILIEHHLAMAEIAAWLNTSLAASPTPPPIRHPHIPSPTPGPFTPSQRAAHRARRRTRSTP